MGECCDGKCHQDLVWKNFVLVSDIRFWYGEFWYGKWHQVLVWETFVMGRDIRFWYGRILLL